MKLEIEKITLSQFRCYDAMRLECAKAAFVVLSGDNGAGKTNVLEAISLLAPGRGLRGADLLEMKNREALPHEGWAVAAEVTTPSITSLRLGTGLDLAKKKRTIRIDGQEARSQTALAEHISLLWLTPQMDRLFIDGPSSRRKFIDRMVFAFDPAHVGRVNRYDATLRERLKLLENGVQDHAWLEALETTLAQTAVSIALSRIDLVRRLSHVIERDAGRFGLFPLPRLQLQGEVEELLQHSTAVQAEERLRSLYSARRESDRQMRRTSLGTHRSDLIVQHRDHAMPAAHCSTGEQKGLLIALTLAHARLMQAERGYAPLLLLDEVAAHLDQRHRESLYEQLKDIGAQVWLTGTDRALFDPLVGRARFYTVENSSLRETSV